MTEWIFSIKNNFSAGELSPTMEGRSDTPLYQQGVRTLLNFLVLPSGGLVRRPGTRCIHIFKQSEERLPLQAEESQ